MMKLKIRNFFLVGLFLIPISCGKYDKHLGVENVKPLGVENVKPLGVEKPIVEKQILLDVEKPIVEDENSFCTYNKGLCKNKLSVLNSSQYSIENTNYTQPTNNEQEFYTIDSVDFNVNQLNIHAKPYSLPQKYWVYYNSGRIHSNITTKGISNGVWESKFKVTCDSGSKCAPEDKLWPGFRFLPQQTSLSDYGEIDIFEWIPKFDKKVFQTTLHDDNGENSAHAFIVANPTFGSAATYETDHNYAIGWHIEENINNSYLTFYLDGVCYGVFDMKTQGPLRDAIYNGFKNGPGYSAIYNIAMGGIWPGPITQPPTGAYTMSISSSNLYDLGKYLPPKPYK